MNCIRGEQRKECWSRVRWVAYGNMKLVGGHDLQVGIAGGERLARLGDDPAGHCRIGDGVIATAQSGIPSDVEAGKMVSGYPAIENRQWLRSVAVFNRLPEILRRLRANGE